MTTQIIITLAHLLHQHSLDYEDVKDGILHITATLAIQTATSHKDSEVHIVLSGSPRPTFAETNGWLLESGGLVSPRKRSSTMDSYASANSEMSQDLQEYMKESQLNANGNMNDLGGSPTRIGGSVLSHYRSRKNKECDIGGGGVNATTNHMGPMVGHAVVNAINQKKGVGLQSSRAKLLQGTIDRPLWDQRRWTDGECLFSDLVDRCGLESFANSSSHDQNAYVADFGAGMQIETLQKTSNLSAHLITVPAQVIIPSTTKSGMDEETVNEIARAVIRILKRKKSPAASTVFLVMAEETSERKNQISEQLMQAWIKLEQYNDMIGQPKLMEGLKFEFVSD